MALIVSFLDFQIKTKLHLQSAHSFKKTKKQNLLNIVCNNIDKNYFIFLGDRGDNGINGDRGLPGFPGPVVSIKYP